MRHHFTTLASELLDSDPRAVVVLADIGLSRFAAIGATARHPDRIVNVGIREQMMISMAAGMALESFRPIVHSYAPFLVERPFEQIKLDLSHQGVGAILVSTGGSYDAADSGRTHQCPEDVALISTLPGWTIHVPGHELEMEAQLRAAMTQNDPVYIRMSDSTNATDRTAGYDGSVVVREGSDQAPVLIAVGPTLDNVIAATRDRDMTVIYTATVMPFDGEALRSHAYRDVVVVEPMLEGTSLPAVANVLSDRPCRLLGIGVERLELRHYGTALDHEAAYGLDPAGIRRRLDAWGASAC